MSEPHSTEATSLGPESGGPRSGRPSERPGLRHVFRRLRSWRDGALLPVRVLPYRMNTVCGKRPVVEIADDASELVIQLDMPGATRRNTEVAIDSKSELWVTVTSDLEGVDPLWQYRFISPVPLQAEQVSARLGSGVLTLRICETLPAPLSLVPLSEGPVIAGEPALTR